MHVYLIFFIKIEVDFPLCVKKIVFLHVRNKSVNIVCNGFMMQLFI